MAGHVVEFYIKNFMRNGTLVTTETKFQTIPIVGEPIIDNPKVKNDLGKAGSFEFEIEPINPFYSCYRQLKTIMRVTYFGKTIFRGRVLTIDKVMKCRRTVHCEGDFAFFMDSPQPGTKEDSRPEITVLEYLQQIVDTHNNYMREDADKLFVLGEVPGQYTSATSVEQRVNIPEDKAKQKFGDTSWNTSMDRLEGLLSDFGGYFRTRYDAENNITYLDWYDNFYNASINPQTIEFAKNLIDISGPTEVENLFTVVIPIGKDKDNKEVYISDYWPIVSADHEKVDYITVPELATVPLYSDAELNAIYHHKADYLDALDRFGWVWKYVTFENADNPEKLFGYAKDWMKNNFMPELTQWSVSALDMKILNQAEEGIYCGDRVNVRHREVQNSIQGLTVISAEHHLYDPKNNKYTIGIPHQEVNAAYGTKSKGGKGGGGGGISRNNDQSEEEELAAQIASVKAKLNTDYYLKTECGRDITLDNPLAFTIYNNDITEKDKSEALKELMANMSELSMTKRLRHADLVAEAIRRGVSVDDVQLLIDFTPSVKQKQTQFRNQSANYMVNTVGMNHQQANVLLNETASQSFLASLVDDQGNWTPYAISQGATIWNNSADLKNQAINTKKWLNGEKTPESVVDKATDAFINFTDTLFGNDLNIDNMINTDKVFDDVTGAVDKVVSFMEQDVQFKLNKQDSQTPNPGATKCNFAKLPNGQWKINFNEPFTYIDAQGQQQTADGSVAAQDFNLPEVASMKTKLIVVDTLIAGKATIGELEAAIARIQTLESTAITTTNMTTRSLTVLGLVAGSIVSNAGITAQDFILRGNAGTWVTINYVSSLDMSVTSSHKFEDADSGQIITGRLVTNYSKQTGSAYVLASV